MDCLFCAIINGTIPVNILFEDEQVLAFEDKSPQAPTHLLIIPKLHISTLNDANMSHTHLLGALLQTGAKLAKEKNLSDDGYRLVLNVNSNGGQSVYHIHLHLLGGRSMTWPPG